MTGRTLSGGAETVGALVNDGYQVVGSSLRTVTDKAPDVGAAYGIVNAGGTLAAANLAAQPWLSAWEAKNIYGATTEALARHPMEAVVMPSLAAHTRQMEKDAIESMRELPQPSPQHGQKPVTPAENPAAFVQQMLDSAKSGDWAAFRNDTQTLANMQPGHDMQANAIATVDRQEQHALDQQVLAQQTMQQQASQQATAPGMSR